MHAKIYTGIGSRETPVPVLEQMLAIGETLASHGWTLRSGHARGADQAFELGSLKAQGKMEIYLPWHGFENAPYNHPGYHVIKNPTAEHIAAQFHPAWSRCSQGARKMHTRNVYQVVGATLEDKSDLVICWTKDGKRQGGTGQALRIADYLDIPIFDLAVCNEKQILDYVNYGIVH